MWSGFVVNDFVTEIFKTVQLKEGYNTKGVTPKDDVVTDKTLSSCALTFLSVTYKKRCLVHSLNVIVKSAPKNEKLRECIPVNDLFKREAFFYNTVLVNLLEFQDQANVDEKFEGTQELVASNFKAPEEAIILRNGREYVPPKYEKCVGDLHQEHIVTVLEELARFHALSFVFSKKKPETFEEFKKELQGGYLWTLENQHTENIVKHNLSQVLKHFSDENVVSKLKKFSDGIGDLLRNVAIQESDSDFLIHGDPTTSFLFSGQEESSENTPLRVKIADWQLVRSGSPALDLSSFLFANCTLEDLHGLNFLKIYHTKLETISKQFKIRISDYFSLKYLEEHWKKFAKFGLALSFITLKILSMEPDTRPNANDENLSSEEFLAAFVQPPNEEFIKRIKDVVGYCIEKELI